METNIIKAMIIIRRLTNEHLCSCFNKIIFFFFPYPLSLYEFPRITLLDSVNAQAVFFEN